MKILVADDDRVHRRLLSVNLARWGHEVLEAADGDQAWALIQQHPDVRMLLLDWEMPGIDGPEICKRVRNSRRHQSVREQYLFILLVTSRSAREDFLEGMRAGADDFISKPVDADELSVRLRAAERVITLQEELGEHNRKLSEANERMRLDLVAAAKVQRSFFPQVAPRVPGYRFGWTFIPCEYVAGDLLNVFQIDERRWAFFILDVSGHGVPAALLSVSLSHLLVPSRRVEPWRGRRSKAAAEEQQDVLANPRDVVRMLNQRFPLGESSGMFCTMVYAVLDTADGSLEWVRAGHVPPLLLRAGGGPPEFFLQPEGMFIGLSSFEDPNLQTGRLTLEPGDRFILYSDGLIESARAEDDEEFGYERLAQTLQAETVSPIDDALKAVVKASIHWSRRSHFADDVTLLALERER